MPTPKRGPRLGAGPAHQKLLLGSQATELFRHGRITTTAAKARALRPYAERLITRAKRGDLHARRMVMRDVRDRDVVAYLFDEIAPRFAERPGGYTRIMKLGPRKGDSAPMVIIELVDRGEGSAEEEIAEAAERRRRGLFGRRRRQRQVPAAEGADLVDDEEFDDEELEDEALEEGEPEDRDVDEDELEPTEADDEAPLTGPDVETTLADVEDPSESKGPAQEPTPPAQDPGAPQELRDDTPDAGDTTGG